MPKKLISIWMRLCGAVESLSFPRSNRWREVRAQHLNENPACAVCGSKKGVVPHHIVPFSVDPTRELDPSNLISLCESPGFNCHLFFGHLKNWSRHNPYVVEDAREWREKISRGTGGR